MSVPRFDFTDRARPFLELGIGDSRVQVAQPARWNVSHWDVPTDLWAGIEPYWRDVSCEAFEVQITMGRDRIADRFVVGTMTVTAQNLTGWADLEPVQPGDINLLMLRPGRSIRFGIDHALGRVVLFRGFIDAMTPRYEPDAEVVTLECVDALGEAGRARLVDDTDGVPESVDTRIDRVLDTIMWPDAKRDLDSSGRPLLPVALDAQAADLLSQAADSAGGAVYGDVEGSVAYRAMGWERWSRLDPPDATIGNVGPDDVCPQAWERPFARADMSNRIILANTRAPDADRVQLDDSSSWTLYGIETFERTDLQTAEVEVLEDLAERYLETRGPHTIPRVRTVTLDARNGDDVVDVLTYASPYAPSRYRCRLLTDRLVFDEMYLLTGVQHQVDPDGWTTQLQLDLAEPYAMAGSARWEPASAPNAGRSRWDRVPWS